MGRFRDYLEKLKQVTEESQTEALFKIAISHKNQMLDLNTEQLFKGRNSAGQQLGEYRNPVYAAFKNRLNPSAGLGTWDLHLTGDLYRSMFVEDGGSFPINIGATDPKASKFLDAQPFGLDEQSKENFREECKEDIQEYYTKVFKV